MNSDANIAYVHSQMPPDIMEKLKQYDNPEIIGKSIEKDIRSARVYYALLSELIVGLREQILYQDCRNVFEYIEIALESQFVLCLSKVFGDTKEGTLWQLLKILENSSDQEFEEKLKKYPSAPHDSMRQIRKKSFENIKNIESKVKSIKEKLKPLRNTERAHNIPWMPKGTEITWGNMLEWLNFAEQSLEQIMVSLCESALCAGNYYSNQFDAEIGHFLKLTKSITTQCSE